MARAHSRALLIGCDFYFPGADKADGNSVRFPHLGGAVRDVDGVENFLVNIGVLKDNIVKLTASHDPLSPSGPIEDDRSKWPTHANIIRELENITERSDHGTLVYIQFSGHGIQRRKLPEGKMASGGDNLFGAALATTDVLEKCGRYLTANELGLRIQAMVRKGLRVTLVLDACFSGRGLRKDTTYTIRTIPEYQDCRDLESDKAAESNAFEYLAHVSGTRQAEMKEDWLSNPVGCTVLTACGIQQTAGEDTFQEMGKDTSIRRGVLTHWMLELLNQRRTPNLPSYTSVKEYVVDKIRTTSPGIHQVPVLYGDTEYEFFGAKKNMNWPTCRVIEMWDDKVRLNVGGAQCVAVGAVYDIYPSGVDWEDMRNFDLALEAHIVKVDTFYSVATLTDINAGQGSDRPSVAEGSSGVLRAWALRDKVLVKFMPDDVHMREVLKNEIEKTPNLALHDGQSEKETFTVRVNQEGNFEIFERESGDNASARLQRLPIIAVNSELAIMKLAQVLRHISRYRDIERIWDLPRSTHVQEEKLDILLCKGSKRLDAIEAGGVRRFDVIEGDSLGLRLKYSGRAPFIWVSIFELNPSWGIVRKYASKLVKDRLEPDEYSKPIDVRTSIPPKCMVNDSEETCDTFMAFIAEGEDEQSWDEIMLNALPIAAEHLQIDTAVDARSTTQIRAHFSTPKALPGRHWGVVSFVIHSSPPSSVKN